MYQAIIIDDEKWVVKSLIATLKDMEHFQIVAELYDGLSAIRYLKENQPDLAFVDVRLPGMSGLEILQESTRLGLKTLFIVISGHAEFAYAQKAMLHNAIGYCLKPFSHSELSDAVSKAYALLEKRRETEDTAAAAAASTIPSADSFGNVASKGKSVAAMVDYINSHYMEDISIQTLADLCSINPNYAGQLFKQKMNQNLSDYLSQVRLQAALSLLRNSRRPLREIAVQCGFRDLNYFCRFIRKNTGRRPSELR